MQIYPSILEENIESFSAQFAKLSPFFDYFQIDIADGEFVGNKTVQIEDMRRGWGDGAEMRRSEGDGEMGGKAFEFHLMVNDYKKEIEKLHEFSQQITIAQVLVHLKPYLNDPLSLSLHLLRQLADPQSPDRPISSSIFQLGLVLSPPDLVGPNWETIKDFKTVQIMTVHPGAQGRPFLPEVLTKISELRELEFSGNIILDGGINDESLKLILANKHLPTAVCPGSYLHEDTENRLKKLRDLVK